MTDSRRTMLKTLAGAAGFLAAGPHLFSWQLGMKPPQPRPSPNAPDPNNPTGLDGPQATKEAPVVPPVNAKEIRDDVEKMYDLVTELKKQVETTNVASTLSINVVNNAHEIEKLAKKVKNLARG